MTFAALGPAMGLFNNLVMPRPMIYHNRAATCRYPRVKGVTVMVNGIYNGWRMEDVWLDK